MQVLKFSNASMREITVKWTPPAERWVKCNVDGSSKEDDISVGCGGIIRDGKGKWILGYSNEPWLYGFEFVRNLGHPRRSRFRMEEGIPTNLHGDRLKKITGSHRT